MSVQVPEPAPKPVTAAPLAPFALSTIFQKYAAALLPFFIIVVGGLQPLFASDDIDWRAVTQFALLVLGAVVTFIVPLVPGPWKGALKTGVQVLVVILTALIQFLIPSGFDPAAGVQLIVVAVLQALAVELGVQIRSGPTTASGAVPDLPSVR